MRSQSEPIYAVNECPGPLQTRMPHEDIYGREPIRSRRRVTDETDYCAAAITYDRPYTIATPHRHRGHV